MKVQRQWKMCVAAFSPLSPSLPLSLSVSYSSTSANWVQLHGIMDNMMATCTLCPWRACVYGCVPPRRYIYIYIYHNASSRHNEAWWSLMQVLTQADAAVGFNFGLFMCLNLGLRFPLNILNVYGLKGKAPRMFSEAFKSTVWECIQSCTNQYFILRIDQTSVCNVRRVSLGGKRRIITLTSSRDY